MRDCGCVAAVFKFTMDNRDEYVWWLISLILKSHHGIRQLFSRYWQLTEIKSLCVVECISEVVLCFNGANSLFETDSLLENVWALGVIMQRTVA